MAKDRSRGKKVLLWWRFRIPARDQDKFRLADHPRNQRFVKRSIIRIESAVERQEKWNAVLLHYLQRDARSSDVSVQRLFAEYCLTCLGRHLNQFGMSIRSACNNDGLYFGVR